VSATSGATTSFIYNGDGVRVAKSTTNGSSTNYVQDLALPLPMVLVESTDGQDTLYLYGKGLIAQAQTDGSRRTYHADLVSSTRAVSDVSGSVAATYSYDVFGAVRSQTGSVGADFTFTGEQTDGETGLEFLRARYDDATIGRFLSQDSLRADPLRPTTLNRYIYSFDNPTRYSDPTGGFGWIASGVPVILRLSYFSNQLVTGFTEFAAFNQSADNWGTSYTQVLDLAGDPHVTDAQWTAALRSYRHESGELLVHTMRAGTAFPGTSFSGDVGAPTSWHELVTEALKWLFFEKGYEEPAKQGAEESISRRFESGPLEGATNPPSSGK
jgi:RHS repeat-associated protein